MISKEFLENLSSIIIGLSGEGKVLLWNTQAVAVTGYKEKGMLGAFPPSFVDQIFDNATLYDRTHLTERRAIREKETTILTRSGDLRFISWNSYNVDPSENSQVTTILVGQDVTRYKISEMNLLKKSRYVQTTKKRLKKYLTLDPHTGLLNYRHFVLKVAKVFNSTRVKGKKMALLIIGVDYLRSVNCIYGFSMGNRILKSLAHIIKQNVSRNYTVGRFSGKEFVVLMPDTDTNKAFKVATSLFGIISNKNFFKEENNNIDMGISTCMAIGGYPHCEDVFRYEQLLDRVVDKLMQAKKSAGHSILICSPRVQEDNAVYEQEEKDGDKDEFRYTLEFVRALANAVKTKDYYTNEHSSVMANYASAMADYIGMSKRDIQNVRCGAMLHDIGKIGIDKLILLKPASLTKDEFAIIRQHPRIGAEIIRNVHPLKEVVPYVLYHHERYNGKGYLQGLQGEEIPLGARIISLADVFQALTSDRPYRRALPKKEVFSIITENSGVFFDPRVVKAFFEIYSE